MSDFYLRTRKNVNDPSQKDIEKTLFFGNGTNDLQVANADFELVGGVENLSQSMAKILVTERGANQLMAIYGSLLQGLVGSRLDIEYLRAKVKQEIIDGLRIYQFINKDNEIGDEQIETLDELKIELEGTGCLSIEFTVITKTGTRVGAVIRLEV